MNSPHCAKFCDYTQFISTSQFFNLFPSHVMGQSYTVLLQCPVSYLCSSSHCFLWVFCLDTHREVTVAYWSLDCKRIKEWLFSRFWPNVSVIFVLKWNTLVDQVYYMVGFQIQEICLGNMVQNTKWKAQRYSTYIEQFYQWEVSGKMDS